ncbi:MAG: hypothetical protein PHH67_03555 [Methanosarcina sp.]|nr:hypothetical protein [Methanosarcina sp.]MDD4305581.1 hypothetical protein [Methanosarcina sp.]MDD4620508.1 hypothetical protein [Methanosarcina sp.]NLN43786.1 hypothetical protein [Methanosarcina sp.]
MSQILQKICLSSLQAKLGRIHKIMAYTCTLVVYPDKNTPMIFGIWTSRISGLQGKNVFKSSIRIIWLPGKKIYFAASS